LRTLAAVYGSGTPGAAAVLTSTLQRHVSVLGLSREEPDNQSVTVRPKNGVSATI
jgi:hypothetical protein